MTSDTFRIRWSQSTKRSLHSTLPCFSDAALDEVFVCNTDPRNVLDWYAVAVKKFRTTIRHLLLAFWLQVSQKTHLVNRLTLHENVLTILIAHCKFYFM